MIGTDEKSPPPYTGPRMIPNPLLRQLPLAGPYGVSNTLSAPSLNLTESHLPPFRPVNRVSHSSLPHWTRTHPAPPPYSVHTDFRQRKAARAQQVMIVLFHGAEKRDCAGYKGNRLTLCSFHCLKGLRPV
jgi:hypothetical protein